MGWQALLPKMARFGPPRITVAVTERTARRGLKLKPPKPIVWNGIPLRCIGSQGWRRRMWELRNLPFEVTSKRCPGCGNKDERALHVCNHCLELAGCIDPPAPTSSEGQS